MKIYGSLCFIATCVTGIFAQYPNTASSDMPYILELGSKPSGETTFEYSFKIDEIVDETSTNGVYGTVVTGLQRTRRYAKFKDGLVYQFTNYINSLSVYNPYGQQIKLVATKLIVGEMQGYTDQNGTVVMSLDYYSNGKLFFHDALSSGMRKKGQSKSYSVVLAGLIKDSLDNLEHKIASN